MKPMWPHQQRGIDEYYACRDQFDHVCITSPTGGGKSRMIQEIIARSRSTTLYTNRKILTGQMIRGFEEQGLYFGVRAAEFKEYFRPNAPVQISSMQTEESRVYKLKRWNLTSPETVIVDEGHMQQGDSVERILADHKAAGAKVVEFTATPVRLSHRCQKLIVAGTNSELRDCGAHVLCHTYEPGTLDFRKLKPTATGEFTEGDVVKKVWTPSIFGHVLTHYHRLNPDRLPCICRCPSVATAVWMAEQFQASDVSAASLDGEEIVINGERIRSDQAAREDLMRRFDSGEINVITFRDVLREAWDFPKLFHLILASPIGSLATYLQVVGRLLRAHPSLDRVILQDHGGNFLRHGSPNSNRDWHDLWQIPPAIIAGERIEQIREKKTEEPIVCPQCFASRLAGPRCHHCGYQSPKKSRQIIQHDGTLKLVEGDVFKPHRIKVKPDTAKVWESYYFRARRAGMSFRQARALFFLEQHYYPPTDLPMMPVASRDWWKRADSKGVKLITKDMAL